MIARPQQGDVARHSLPLLGLFFVLTIAPLFFTTLTRDIFVMPKALVISAGLLISLIGMSWNRTILAKTDLSRKLLWFFAANVLSLIFTLDTPMSLLGPHQHQNHAMLPLAMCILAFYVSANAHEASSDEIVYASLIGGVVVSAVALTQVGGDGFMPWTIQNGRAGSTFGSPLYLAPYLAMLLPLAWARRGLWYWVAALILAGLLATKSRGPLAAAGIGIILCEILSGNQKRAAAMSAISGLVVAYIFHARGAHGSDLGRIEVWKTALVAFKAHPILGWGPDTFSLAFAQYQSGALLAIEKNDFSTQMSAHNDMLQVLATTGIVGFVAYIAVLVSAIKAAARWFVWDKDSSGIIGALVAVFICAKFNPLPLTVMVMAAVLLGLLDRSYEYYYSEDSRCVPVYTATAAALLVFSVIGIYLNAERHQRLGEDAWQRGRSLEAAEEFNQAAKVNPFDLWFTQRQLDYFWKVVAPVPGINKEVLARYSHVTSENALRLHPASSVAHELRSISYEFEGDMLGRDRYWEAFNEIMVAEQLSPKFGLYAKRRECILQRRDTKSKKPCYTYDFQGLQGPAKS